MMLNFKGKSPKIASDVFIAEGAKIIGEVEIGKNSSIWFNCVLRGDENFIKIGERTNIQDLTTLHIWHRLFDDKGKMIDSGFPVIIGDDVTIGHNCIIHACQIHSCCLVGMHTCIMDNVEIGEESIVGAGSIVTKGKKFPPRSLILGNPAKFVRELKKEEIALIIESAQNYVRFKNDFLANSIK
ncbi:gamma carbonic anhydrase family protein [uncultured Helicobacter sp.]|uniref:gamma carbonic anhydrase family protein n=1 Tax=uncultured Helicobacter sp. TaxID=175537 RepID=UPI0026057E19|nr:gamma carbonic anhydrase family protein [uncultured Helicobacter sp.]